CVYLGSSRHFRRYQLRCLTADSTHPGAPTAHNYWYVKLDAKACYNLSPYSAIQFDLKGPAGTNFGITLTQKSANCSTRLVDSVYKNLTDYVTMDGTKKTVTLPVKDFSTNLLGAGFDLNITGIEASLSDIGFEQDHGKRFLRLVGQNGLRYILGLYTCWTDYYGEPEKAISVPVLLQRLETQLEQALSLDPRPVHLNCHAGLDDMALEDSIEFFRQANVLTQRMLAGTGIGLSYETHRGRILYSPWIALQLLKSVEIEFTLDLSHWIVVLERQVSWSHSQTALSGNTRAHLGQNQTHPRSNGHDTAVAGK
ncbi:hypothetical protein HDU91_002218, partial [Kappamyces sp. JEL0680]